VADESHAQGLLKMESTVAVVVVLDDRGILPAIA